MVVYVCSNRDCRAVHDKDPHGHCPTCIQPNGGGWSTIPVDPDEQCRCGDYRKDHAGYFGKCKMPNDLTHGFEPCTEFQPVT